MSTNVKTVNPCTKCRKSDLVDTRSNFCYRCKATVKPSKPATSPQVLEYMALSAANQRTQRTNKHAHLFRVIVGAFIGALLTTTIVGGGYLIFQFLNNNFLFNTSDILVVLIGSLLFGSLVGAGIGYALKAEKAD